MLDPGADEIEPFVGTELSRKIRKVRASAQDRPPIPKMVWDTQDTNNSSAHIYTSFQI